MAEYFKENDTDFKWYVVHISQPGKELELKKLLQKNFGKVGNILDFYCPVQPTRINADKYDDARKSIPQKIRVRDRSGKKKTKIERVLPLFAGMVFVRATQTALKSFLTNYFPTGSIMYSTPISTQPAPIVIKDEQMKALKDFNDNLPAEPILLQKPFNDYSFNKNTNEPNETIMVVDGVLAGRTGYLIRINGNRGLAFQMKDPVGTGYLTVGIPNIRFFHIVRVHNTVADPMTWATKKQRAVDLLIGLIQGAGYQDNRVLSVLYDIVDFLRTDSSFNKCADYIKSLNHSYKDERLTDKIKGSNKALSLSLKSLSAEAQRLILYLIWYEDKNPGYVINTYQHLLIRPFLTPTSGIPQLEGTNYSIFRHHDFIELIKPVEIAENVDDPQNPKEKAHTATTLYYAHIGIKAQKDKFIIFANWDGFLSAYFATEGKANYKVLNGKNLVTYQYDQAGNVLIDKETNKRKVKKSEAIESFRNYATPLYNVLIGESEVKAVKDFVVKSTKTSAQKLSVMCIEAPKDIVNTKVLESSAVQKSVNTLIDVCVDICKTLSSETHIKMWRDYLMTVWLHK
jgi:transcription antitermination factor NusG